MKKYLKKTCADCSHCKVSKNSYAEFTFCFCDVKKERLELDIEHWQKKATCQKFDFIGDEI